MRRSSRRPADRSVWLRRPPRTSRSRRPSTWRSPRARCARSLPGPMLTDYHVHLRQDEPENTAEQAFTAANAERYAKVASERGVELLGVAEHVYRFRQALDVWQHPFWRDQAR